MWRRFEIRDRIQQLDPKADCHEIVQLAGTYEFPWLLRKSMEFALFRTFGVPRMSKLLDYTGQFRLHGQRRLDDTALLFAELVEHGSKSSRGRQTLRLINRMHGKYGIHDDDMLYTLSTLIFESMIWTRKYGWRSLTRNEIQGNYYFWVDIGTHMGIKDIPESLEAFERWQREYVRDNLRYAPTNRRVADASVQVILNWLPRFTRPLVRQIVYALLDDDLRRAFGYPRPWPLVSAALHGSLLLAGKLMRFMPPRREPYLVTKGKIRSYPDGYRLEELGPPEEIHGAGEAGAWVQNHENG